MLNFKGVVVKIVKVGSDGENLLVNTTKYTNFQNSVSQKDFIALEKNFKHWQTEMESRYNIYLEIQRGGWESAKSQNQKTFDIPSSLSFIKQGRQHPKKTTFF